MKATKKDIQRIAISLKQDFKEGNCKGSFSDRLETIVLGYQNAFRAGNSNAGIESRGKYLYLWTDIKI